MHTTLRNTSTFQSPLKFMRQGLSVICFAFLAGSVIAQGSHSGHICGEDQVLASADTILFGKTAHFSFNSKAHTSGSWKITNQNGTEVFSGQGLKTGDLTFDASGQYDVIFSVPGHDEKLTRSSIYVKDNRVSFDFLNARFSETIRNGVSADGITLTVPVHLHSYSGKSVTISAFKKFAESMGVSYELAGDVALKPGKNQLVLHFSGTPRYEGGIGIALAAPGEREVAFTVRVQPKQKSK